jgi:ribosomal protein S18 acetylase RimI-like enzyme
MAELIVFDVNVHRPIYIDLCEEYFGWTAQELLEKCGIDVFSVVDTSLRDFIENGVDEFITSIQHEGVFYLLQEDEEIVGMGAVRKLRDGIGEIKRMYIKPEFQGRGWGRRLLERLLEEGRERGLSEIYLETGNFMAAAQQLYRSMGFEEREMYPETEVMPELQPVWLFMEKKI